MHLESVGKRGKVISFPELDQTNIYLIFGPTRTFLCDTFLGPDPMEDVIKFLANQGRTQPVVVFNSHKDWDHVWGNCAFPGSTILATERSAAYLQKHFASELAEYGDWAQGDVEPVFPNLLFTGQIFFPEDQVLFFSSPGHTDGSASCLDLDDGILFVGDNVEYPLPYLYSKDLKSYVETLTEYLRLEPKSIITGHGVRDRMTIDLIRANLDYVRAIEVGTELDGDSWNESHRAIHQQNLSWLADNS